MRRKNIKKVIKEYFFVNPTSKLRVRQIEKSLKLPLPSVIRYCNELEKERLLAKIRTGNIVFYTANKGDEKFTLEKKFFNLKSLYDSGLVNFLRTELSNPVIVVFGSYAKGEDIENSDIDLYVETPSKKKIDLKKYEKKLNRKIQLMVHKNLREVGNNHLINNIINGFVLNGFLEALK